MNRPKTYTNITQQWARRCQDLLISNHRRTNNYSSFSCKPSKSSHVRFHLNTRVYENKQFHFSHQKRDNEKSNNESNTARSAISGITTSQIVENVKVLETSSSTTNSSQQPSAPPATATIVIIQQQQQAPQVVSSSAVSTHTMENQLTTPGDHSTFHHFSATSHVDMPITQPQSTTTSTIIKIDSQVISKEIEKAVSEQIKQKLKHAYEPSRDEYEVIEHLEQERLYEEGTRQKMGFIQKIRTFLRKRSTLLSNLLLVGKVLPANAIATLFFSYYKMEKNYKQRCFEQRITASLNFIDHETNTFKVRNIFCKNLDEVVLNNQAVVQLIQEAAANTTSESPIVILPDDDKWFCLHLIQSVISQNVSASGYFRQDMKLKHHSEWYVFGITNEVDVTVRKMRVVIVQEQLLKKIQDGTLQEPQFEHIYGEVRWNTVKLMAKMYREQYDSIMHTGFGDLMRVEIVLSM
ncbi:hypothetical protein C9374_009384 [Naegleria lovaniensis]|uniref:Uncharacterized protein n=1 Tax=Naegleria lovaniensis TaxID=51637 RepID=A0AA88KH55_NAELO|nr:uncharacterized protein C9374_009384 [Naegleria lovaniensis]KAG2377473.1 hypothetical protein C9374_009384 [Naegleria lovaniensis]